MNQHSLSDNQELQQGKLVLRAEALVPEIVKQLQETGEADLLKEIEVPHTKAEILDSDAESMADQVSKMDTAHHCKDQLTVSRTFTEMLHHITETLTAFVELHSYELAEKEAELNSNERAISDYEMRQVG